MTRFCFFSFFQMFSVNKQTTRFFTFLVLLLALHSLHVVVHVHKPAQPGSVEGSITAWRVHAHLLLVAIPFLNMNASCLRLCVCGCGCLQNGGFWVICLFGVKSEKSDQFFVQVSGIFASCKSNKCFPRRSHLCKYWMIVFAKVKRLDF